MALHPDAVGMPQDVVRHAWTSKDALLYALGVGAGVDDLAFTTENSHAVPQRVLPTFGVLPARPGNGITGLGQYDPAMLVHAGQEVVLHDELPPEGEVEVSGQISAVQDRGAGGHAVVVLGTTACDVATGTKLITARYTLIIRNAGGFGGPSAPAAARPAMPDTPPDVVATQRTRPDQALLYRLSGDRNPLHSDPWFARERAGFPRPILHGLCTYGFAGRALLAELCDGDVTRFGRMAARFSAPVFPGEELTTSIWRAPDGALFRTTAAGPDRVAIDDGVFEFRLSS